ncbi:hypothetical protein BcepGomrgene58 [Burkholderia phage BcepGomr]|uniref:hypothetical protein n=1 Tax=Burkholderia phage BcepGomr TaxID=437329 RepID=UPI000150350B|nr:hypothetical protein BcepGomrgene58 [Burkholderia phage BcepGomr]ABP63629.1 BcepGomrgp58 [Burkholderia phage BcepGomr]
MNTERIIDRIKKMLALANDLAATEGERDNALRMAYNTMAKYNIDMATVDARSKQEERVNFTRPSWSWIWARHVNKIVGELFFCKYYYSTKINGTQCIHHFVGKESNAMTAAVMADFIVNSILKEGRSIYKQNTAPGTRAFAMGAMHALYARVEQIKAERAAASEAATPGTALVLANLYLTEMQANEAFCADIEITVTKAKARAINDTDAYYAGQAYGESINLDLQVAEEQRKLK